MDDIKALDIRTVNLPGILLEVSMIIILFSYSFLILYFFT
jgi:hypothetical protein